MVNAWGVWSFDYTNTALIDGTYQFKATATDAAGNTSADSVVLTVVVDTTFTDSRTDLISVVPPFLASDTANSKSFQPAISADGCCVAFVSNSNLFIADQDSYRNVFRHSVDIPTVITGISEDLGGSSSDGITSDTTLVIRGAAEPDTTVTVYRDNTSIGTTTTSASGDWSFDHKSTALAEGSHQFKISATDLAGNTSPDSPTFIVMVDLTPPTASIQPVLPSPRNTPAGVVTVNFNEPMTGVDADDFSLIRNGAVVSLAGLAVGRSGDSYTLDLSTATVADGAYVFSLTASGSGIQDAAGNSLARDASIAFTVHPWHNYANPRDVAPSGPWGLPDGRVTALDALVIINYINEHTGLIDVPAAPTMGPPYYDVAGGPEGDGDGYVSPLDVLVVIIYINELPPGAGEGEAVAQGALLAGLDGQAFSNPVAVIIGRLAPVQQLGTTANNVHPWSTVWQPLVPPPLSVDDSSSAVRNAIFTLDDSLLGRTTRIMKADDLDAVDVRLDAILPTIAEDVFRGWAHDVQSAIRPDTAREHQPPGRDPAGVVTQARACSLDLRTYEKIRSPPNSLSFPGPPNNQSNPSPPSNSSSPDSP